MRIGQENLTQSHQERQEKIIKNLCVFARELFFA
jgi:hypothetical protein